ncbi:MAG TPA: hypothetical protein VKR06_08755 [Ktedonosporobacter sp.]|nr:hypothetical protein [Ktedonosporobacter sp.]
MDRWVLLLALAFTLYMTGVIVNMQLLEYPLFALVGKNEFPRYHAFHNRSLFVLVLLPMLLALIGSVALVWIRPSGLPLWPVILAIVSDLGIFVSTVILQAPLHARLDRDGFSAEVIKTLVRTNWIRTLLWIVSSVSLLGMTALALGG